MSKILRWAGLAILAALVVIQFFGIDKTNPPINQEEEFMALVETPPDVAKLLKDACYDCHSHETQYPWYTNVAPVSWWIANHIEEGRKHFNLSTWGAYDAEKKAHKAEEASEELEKGKMPLTSYPPAHPEARLSDAQRERLSSWFRALSEQGGVLEKAQEGDNPPPAENRESSGEEEGPENEH